MLFYKKTRCTFALNPSVMKNYYHILRVPIQADDSQIRRAYRDLSKKYHPDCNGGSRYCEERFKEINEAYQVLKNPLLREQLRRAMDPRPYQASANGKWAPPDYTQAYKKPRQAQCKPKRPQQGYRPPQNVRLDMNGLFWSGVLFLIFLMPFMMARRPAEAPVGTAAYASFAAYDDASNDRYDYDFKAELDRRYRRDVQYLNEIQRIDPGFHGLDLDTGRYRLHGRTITLSWEILQLIREKHWKMQ